MAKWTKDEIRGILQERIKFEVERKKSFKEKLSMTDIADVMADFVIALMADARRREVSGMLAWMKVREEGRTERRQGVRVESQEWLQMENHLVERKREMKVMAEILWNYAERKENERPKKGYR